MFCTKCGAQCADNLSFCPNCGSALAAGNNAGSFTNGVQGDSVSGNRQAQYTQQWDQPQQAQYNQQWNQQPQQNQYTQQWSQQSQQNQYTQQWNQQPQQAQYAQQWNQPQQAQYTQQWNQPQQPQYGQQYGQPYTQQIPMGWANFLGYFALWAGAVVNIASAVTVFSGNQYGGWASAVYNFFPGMKSIDVMYGILLLALSALGVFAGVCLLTKKKLTLQVVPLTNLIAGIVSILYLLLSISIVGANNYEGETIATGVISMLVELALFFVNRIYFKKRESIYIN